MHYDPSNPLIVQGDRSVLVEVDNPRYGEARDALAPFAELEKSPEHIHTYRITPLSLWNARAAGMAIPEMTEALTRFSKFDVPQSLLADIRDLVSHLKDRGIGVLITDHNVRETLEIVDRAYILHEGRVLREGVPAEIVADVDVRRVYLGERFSL